MKITTIGLIVLPVFVIGLSGCLFKTTMPQQITSLNVDCKTSEIKISNESVELNGTEKWIAKCDGKTYSCTYLPESGSDCYEIIE